MKPISGYTTIKAALAAVGVLTAPAFLDRPVCGATFGTVIALKGQIADLMVWTLPGEKQLSSQGGGANHGRKGDRARYR